MQSYSTIKSKKQDQQSKSTPKTLPNICQLYTHKTSILGKRPFVTQWFIC